MERLTVTVVIATYNRAGMLRQALDAVLAQSRPADEIVALDDASTDSTWELLQRFAAACPRLRIFRRETNSGGIPAWNQAAQMARSQALAFSTDDDRFLPDHLEASLDYLERHPETSLVHSGFIDVLETGDRKSIEPRKLRAAAPLCIRRADLARYMTRYYDWPLHPSTLVLRRELWERTGGFDPRYALADTDWFVRAVEQSPAVLLPRYGVYNRRHAGNWSNRLGSARMQGEIFSIIEAMLGRVYAGLPAQKAFWKAAWRAQVRLRLLLTLAARVKSGHEDAACAAWTGVLRVAGRQTGRNAPGWVERGGARLIRRLCRQRMQAAQAGESVIPL